MRRVAPVAEADLAEVSDAVPEEKVAYVKSLFEDVLEVKQPTKMDVFLKVLQGSGYTVLGKGDWKEIGGDLHPLMLPLATRGEGDALEVVGLLVREPTAKFLMPNEYLVVMQRPRRSKTVQFMAKCIDQYIARRAEEANFAREKKDLPVIKATKDVYEVRFSGNDRTALDKWLLLKVGPFPDVYKNLAMQRLASADPKSGLVIADTMRDAFGTSWGFPHAFTARVLRRYFGGEVDEWMQEVDSRSTGSRDEEADHSAQRCFTSGYPLWTLEEDEPLADLLLQAKMPKMADLSTARVFYLKRVVDDQRVAQRVGSLSEGCATLAKGQALMDAVCCGHKSYAGIRQELSEMYDEVVGCDGLVNMIRYFMA